VDEPFIKFLWVIPDSSTFLSFMLFPFPFFLDIVLLIKPFKKNLIPLIIDAVDTTEEWAVNNHRMHSLFDNQGLLNDKEYKSNLNG
jgi:hypothetical protein